MEKRYRSSLLRWVGSILIALLIIGSIGFGAYRLYALGWTRGVAAVHNEPLNQTPRVLAVQPYRYHRMVGSPLLSFILIVIVCGAVIRHSAWRMHKTRTGWRHGPAEWNWHCHHANHPGCEDPRAQNAKVEDKEEGAV